MANTSSVRRTECALAVLTVVAVGATVVAKVSYFLALIDFPMTSPVYLVTYSNGLHPNIPLILTCLLVITTSLLRTAAQQVGRLNPVRGPLRHRPHLMV